MPGPGLRRADFAAFTSRVDATGEQLFESGDSKANHQQYTDFLRSSMARNGSVLMTCSSCHDAHGSDQNAHELRSAATDNKACTGCHSEQRYTQVRDHIKRATNEAHDNLEDAALTCTACHMVKTIAAGARHPELLDFLPRTAPELQYAHGDLASHRFKVTRRAQAALQPVAATLSCAFCHSMFLDNP
jgi:predicted CXXCH cytochrome family protein